MLTWHACLQALIEATLKLSQAPEFLQVTTEKDKDPSRVCRRGTPGVPLPGTTGVLRHETSGGCCCKSIRYLKEALTLGPLVYRIFHPRECTGDAVWEVHLGKGCQRQQGAGASEPSQVRQAGMQPRQLSGRQENGASVLKVLCLL